MNQFEDWLFAAPWWVLVIAAAAALGFLLFAMARLSRRLTHIGIVALLLVAVWAAMSYFVVTPVEQAKARTADIVAAYRNADWQRLSELIDEETRFAGMLRGQDIVRAAELTHEDLGHGDVRITQMQAQRDDLGIRITIQVHSEQRAQYMARLNTAWRFDYRRWDDRWELEKVEALPTQFLDPAAILRHVRMPPGAPARP